MTDVLHVSLREETGTSRVRRLRRQGLIPAVLYGHGEANVNLSVPTSELVAIIRHGHKMVDLSGGVTEKALIRAVQWDTYGSHVLHLDLNRVSETERVVVTVPIELRGEAPGVKLGGQLDHHLFDVEIECPAGEIPEKLSVSLKELGLGAVITVGDLALPEHVAMQTSADTVVVSCHAPTAEMEEELAEAAGAAEPELIGRKAEETEEESD